MCECVYVSCHHHNSCMHFAYWHELDGSSDPSYYILAAVASKDWCLHISFGPGLFSLMPFYNVNHFTECVL